MKNLFDQMSDDSIKLMGMAFALALERKVFLRGLLKYSVLTAEEILLLHYAALNNNVKVLRDMLNKINDFMEDITVTTEGDNRNDRRAKETPYKSVDCVEHTCPQTRE